MSHVLIVEDDFDIAAQVKLFFEANQFKTTHISDGAKVIEGVKTHSPDVVLLDIMLPNKNGVECLREIRQFSNVPVVMLTAKAEEADRLKGLEVGADDYVCKPFSAAELVMRVKAILRRCALIPESTPEPQIDVNEAALTVSLFGQVLSLTKVEFEVFALLYKAPSRVFSRQQILDYIQPDNFDISDRVIDSHIKNIRKKIKQIDVSPKLVESVYGAGYRYNAQYLNEET
ncbi:DNA-binding response regulator [Pseudoalteromonas luteoviolacea B = ATCC 29581]|nr:DNA-binding response regulator [Pseudoalteromonas luteoviolacea B = ATCC 29581]